MLLYGGSNRGDFKLLYISDVSESIYGVKLLHSRYQRASGAFSNLDPTLFRHLIKLDKFCFISSRNHPLSLHIERYTSCVMLSSMPCFPRLST